MVRTRWRIGVVPGRERRVGTASWFLSTRSTYHLLLCYLLERTISFAAGFVRREIEAASSKQAESAPKAEENSIEIVDVSKDSADVTGFSLRTSAKIRPTDVGFSLCRRQQLMSAPSCFGANKKSRNGGKKSIRSNNKPQTGAAAHYLTMMWTMWSTMRMLIRAHIALLRGPRQCLTQ